MSLIGQALQGVELSRRTLADEVFDTLRSRILQGEIPPGERLRISDVSATLQVSSGPVRDAFARLAGSGLLEVVPHQGAVVANLSTQLLRELYAIRLLLEPEAARLGLQRLDELAARRLEGLLADMRRAVSRGDHKESLMLDERFLSAVYGAGGNHELVSLIESVWSRVQPYKLLYTTTTPAAATRAIDCDAALLDAVGSMSSRCAAAVLRASLEEARDELDWLLTFERRERGLSC